MEWSTFETENQEEPSQFSPLKRQLLTALISNTAAITCGISFGFSAILIPQLQQPSSDIQINLESSSWIASVVPLLMIFSSFITGPLMERFGRKKAHFIHAVPTITGMFIIYFASNWPTLLIGRIVWGIGVGVYAAVFPAYYAEISDPKYRGIVMNINSVCLALGIFFSHLLGTYLTWRWTVLISIIFPISTIALMNLVPESPSWFVSKNKYEDALKAFKWLRGNQAREEFEIMWEQHKNFVTERNLAFEVLAKPEFYKPFLIVILMFLMFEFSGIFVVAFYSTQIFKEILGSSKIDEYLLMISFDIGRILCAFISLVILKFLPRRSLMLIGGFTCALCTLALAVLFLFKISGISTWIILMFFTGYFLAVVCAIGPVCWCSAGELIPLKYRSLGSSSTIAFNYFFFFISIKVAPEIMNAFGIGAFFAIIGCISMVITIILYFVMPDTKNLTLEQIEMYFSEE